MPLARRRRHIPAAAPSRPACAGFGSACHLLDQGVEPEVLEAFESSLRALAEAGAAIDAVDLPHDQYAVPVYYLIATAEASSNLARYDGVRYGARAAGAETLDDLYARSRSAGFGAEVKRRIMLGTYALSAGYYDAFYVKAQQFRGRIRDDFARALDGRHALALPTAPTRAFPLGARLQDPLQMYLSDIFTVAPALAGLPAISVPARSSASGTPGRTDSDLPVGVQLIGRAWDDATIFRIAAALER